MRKVALAVGNRFIRLLCSSAPSDIAYGIQTLRVETWKRIRLQADLAAGYAGEQQLCIAIPSEHWYRLIQDEVERKNQDSALRGMPPTCRARTLK